MSFNSTNLIGNLHFSRDAVAAINKSLYHLKALNDAFSVIELELGADIDLARFSALAELDYPNFKKLLGADEANHLFLKFLDLAPLDSNAEFEDEISNSTLSDILDRNGEL